MNPRTWDRRSMPLIDGADEDFITSFMGGTPDLAHARPKKLDATNVAIAKDNSRQIVGSVDTTFTGPIQSVTNNYASSWSQPSVEDLQRQKYRHILEWLSPRPHDHRTTLKSELSKRLDGTGAWFFESGKYLKWLSGSEPSLWLIGGVGTGKTVLCSSVISSLIIATKEGHFSSSDVFICFFFFSFQDNTRQSLLQLLKVILGQLCKPSLIPKPLESLYERCQEMYPPDEPSEEELRETLIETLRINCTKTVSMESEVAKDVFILIDALDEVPQNQTDSVTALLQDLNQLGLPSLRILCTSRYQPDIDLALSKPVRWQQQDMKKSCIAQDIERFVLKALSSSRLRSLSQQVKIDIVEGAARQGVGMFRLAALKVGILKELPLRGREDVAQALSTLPATLHETYTHMLLNIPDTIQKVALSALKWMVAAKRPLFIEEVLDAAYIRTSSPLSEKQHDNRCPASDLVQVLRALATVEPRVKDYENIPAKHHTIMLSHNSVQEFLTGTEIGNTRAKSFAFSIDAANDAIGRGCIISQSTHFWNTP
ncbi:hypothetical protein CGCFRS4_v011684 [Colletotrichum fructicola]|uniref:Ankyrin repeat protein n=1 Tax=Colletotrichum fructicola (strain Nara gc5) TaxID=1213859 RepID=L2FHA9_COLFN|nr:hypothetical protein CGCFRS4_v011684 [Colletotrichum fructicola]